MTDIIIAMGTRPEIIKMAPIIRELMQRDRTFKIAYTGQHYDYNLSLQFIEELNLPEPEYDLKVKEVSPGSQTGRIIIEFEKIIKKERPLITLVEGDTNSVLATALASNKQKVTLGHVEAGLRSFDLRMPEEHNRRLVDHISDYLFAPTENARRNLEREGVWGKIYVTGNTVVDACQQHIPIAEEKSRIMEKIEFDEYLLATVHRAENVDDPRVLGNFVEAFMAAPLPVVLPAHPRTAKRLRQAKLWKRASSSKNLIILPAVGYLDFLLLMKNCRMILTDSGGIQEEATVPSIRKRVLVLRLSTERPEAVETGFAKVVGVEKDTILKAIDEKMTGEPLPKESPYGDGHSGERITDIVLRGIYP